jgi:hypothetical protein
MKVRDIFSSRAGSALGRTVGRVCAALSARPQAKGNQVKRGVPPRAAGARKRICERKFWKKTEK